MHRRWIVTLFLLACAGCAAKPPAAVDPTPVTRGDPATTQPGYWYAKPSPATIVYPQFAPLFDACEHVVRSHRFIIDRADYRDGLITSDPLVTSQLFEPWRSDVQAMGDSHEATLATIRRTVRVDIVRDASEGFVASPKVLVERQAAQDRRITNVVLYSGQFKRVPNPDDQPRGTKETDQGIYIPGKYWYALGRDVAMEKKLAHEISARLAKRGAVAEGAPGSQ